MVSPTSTTPQTPALSYAESAKKAQGVKLASQVAQKPLSNPPRQPPAPVLDSKKAGLNSSTLETPLTSLADLSLHDVPSSGANPSAPTSPSASTSHTSTTIPIDSLPSGIVSSTSTKAVPPPNVWNQRIQQRAQTRPPPRPPQSLPHMTQSHVLRVPSPTRDPPSTSSSSRQPDVPVSSVQTPASPSVLNGASGTSSTSSPSTGTTPSLRREPLPHPPPVDDAETWPEVGKSQTYAGKPQRVSNGYTGPVEVKDVEEKDSDGLSPSHPGTPRKSASFLHVHISKPIFFSI
jgi:la-related protein 1